ncbi:hypothetical protein ACFLTR_03320 [Chloroflexota bacterium]
MRSPRTQRILDVIARGIFGLTLAVLTIYLVWYEFGVAIFKQPVFSMLLGLWAMYGIMFLFDRVEKAMEKTTSEKIDDLTNKIDELIDILKAYFGGENDGK